MNIQLVHCAIKDLQALQTISRTTFFETFHDQNSKENMTSYLNNAFADEKLLNELQNPDSIFKLLYVDEELAGYLKVNYEAAQTENISNETAEIERIYILNEFQKKGLGKVVMDEAIRLAKDRQKTMIWLGVWKENTNAIAFYEKIGFQKTGSHSFIMGDEEQIDFIMTKKL